MRILSLLAIMSALLISEISAEMMITEIMYDPVGTEQDKEWIEVYNKGPAAINLSGWKIQDGTQVRSLSLFSGGEFISAGSIAIFANNAENFTGEYPAYAGAIFDSTFSLANTGEALYLLDDGSLAVDFVNYTDMAGQGFTMELNGTEKDNSDMANWIEGIEKGNPGSALSFSVPDSVPEFTTGGSIIAFVLVGFIAMTLRKS